MIPSIADRNSTPVFCQNVIQEMTSTKSTNRKINRVTNTSHDIATIASEIPVSHENNVNKETGPKHGYPSGPQPESDREDCHPESTNFNQYIQEFHYNAERPRSRTLSKTASTECCIIDVPEDVHNESCTDQAHRHRSNLLNVLLRNSLSVGMPTAWREFLRRKLLPELLSKAPGSVAPVLGVISIITPVALQLAGLVRDYRNGTATKKTVCARIAIILSETIPAAALISTGGLSAAAPALVAALFGYAFPRDVIQYFFRLKNTNSSDINIKTTVISAIAYGVNQTGVGFASAILAEKLKPFVGEACAYIISHTLINLIGETTDEIVSNTVKAYVEEKPALKISAHVRAREDVTMNTAADTILNTAASRGGLFMSVYSASSAVNIQEAKANILASSILAINYIPFFYTHAQKQRTLPPDVDIELGPLPA